MALLGWVGSTDDDIGECSIHLCAFISARDFYDFLTEVKSLKGSVKNWQLTNKIIVMMVMVMVMIIIIIIIRTTATTQMCWMERMSSAFANIASEQDEVCSCVGRLF